MNVNSSYKEVTRRLNPRDLENIEQKMDAISEQDCNDFLNLVEAGNIEEIIKIKKYPEIALRALQKNKISEKAFATIVMPSASLDDDKKCVPLFLKDSNKKNPLAEKYITNTLKMNDKSILSTQKIDEFFQKMQNLPKIQQHFWVESVPRNDGDESVRDRIQSVYRLNVFSVIESDKEHDRVMIPSLEMMQTFLNLKFPYAVEINPVLGLSSDQDLEENGRKSKRDMALRFPEVPLPDTADGYQAKGTSFTHHDFFHSVIVSLVPKEIRTCILDIAAAVNMLRLTRQGEEKQNLEELYRTLVDMETSGQHKKITNEVLELQPIKEFIEFVFSSIFKANISIWDTTYITYIVTIIAAKKILCHPEFYIKEPFEVFNFLAHIPLAIVQTSFKCLYKEGMKAGKGLISLIEVYT